MQAVAHTNICHQAHDTKSSNWKRKACGVLLLLAALFFAPNFATANTPVHWNSLAKGLDYAVISPNPSFPIQKIHAFRIDLSTYQLSLLLAKDYQQPSFFVNQIASSVKALIAINGGFFSPEFKPLGLRVNNGKLLQPIKNTSWWGVFIVKGNHAFILPQPAFRYSKKIQFAVQAGPRLIVNGKIPSLSGKIAERSALGITKSGKIIIAITENVALSTTQFANIMKTPEQEGGFACYNALNLDGGSSSQLYTNVGNFNLQIRSIRPVTDVVAVTERK